VVLIPVSHRKGRTGGTKYIYSSTESKFDATFRGKCIVNLYLSI